jgi:hypothetical protein
MDAFTWLIVGLIVAAIVLVLVALAWLRHRSGGIIATRRKP